MSTRNEMIADLLMGAAYADKELDGRELDTVKALLAKVTGQESLSPEMSDRLRRFNPNRFDAAATAKALGLTDNRQKRYLIEMIAAVTEADDNLDLAENEYLETVAEAMALPRQTFTDLTLEILSVENLEAAGESLLTPPPIPGK
jgi:protein-disulfide isomerase-like protein with CxxC motif